MKAIQCSTCCTMQHHYLRAELWRCWWSSSCTDLTKLSAYSYIFPQSEPCYTFLSRSIPCTLVSTFSYILPSPNKTCKSSLIFKRSLTSPLYKAMRLYFGLMHCVFYINCKEGKRNKCSNKSHTGTNYKCCTKQISGFCRKQRYNQQSTVSHQNDCLIPFDCAYFLMVALFQLLSIF